MKFLVAFIVLLSIVYCAAVEESAKTDKRGVFGFGYGHHGGYGGYGGHHLGYGYHSYSHGHSHYPYGHNFGHYGHGFGHYPGYGHYY